MELILRAANISTTLPEPDLNTSTSPQLTHLLMTGPGSQGGGGPNPGNNPGGGQGNMHNPNTTTMHNMQPPTNSPTMQHSSSLPGNHGNVHHSPSSSSVPPSLQHSSSVPGTLHHLLKTHHDSSSPMTLSSSVDSPRRMDIHGSIEEDDCVLMEGD